MSRERGQRSEPPGSPGRTRVVVPVSPPPSLCLALLKHHGPATAGPQVLAAALWSQDGAPSCCLGRRWAEPGRGRSWGPEGLVVGAGRGAATPRLPWPGGYSVLLGTERGGPRRRCPAAACSRTTGEAPVAQPCPRHRAKHGHLCVAALQSMREDPDPMVSCLATQTCYVVEAKGTPLAQPPTSCLCPRRP